MKSQQFKNIRKNLGLDRLGFARLIGFTGTDRNDINRVAKFEGSRQVPLYIARLVWLIAEYRRITGRNPAFPDWPGYDYDHSPDPQHQKEQHDGV